MATEEQTYRESVMNILKDIKEQTTKTNGRVSVLEDRYQFVRGAMWVIGSLLTLIMLPVAFILISAVVGHYV